MISSDATTVTTGLLVAFAILVIFIRTKNWLDSNLPLFFYAVMIAYTRAVDSRVPILLILVGLGLSLLLRFEFMNTVMIRIVRYLEIAVLIGIVYLSVQMVLQ